MKRLLYIFFIVLLCGLFSCAREELVVPGYEGVSASLIKDLGLDEPEMPVRLGFDLPGEKITYSTKASVVGGEENTSNFIQNLYLICFTKEGIYLGFISRSRILAAYRDELKMITVED